MKGMKEMDRIGKAIDKVIKTPVKTPSASQARELLRNCGILDKNHRVSRDYKDIFFEASGGK